MRSSIACCPWHKRARLRPRYESLLGFSSLMVFLPLDANVQLMTVMATKMAFIGRG